MVQFKINGEIIPFKTAYEELTLREFFAIRDKSKDIFDTLEILSGVSAKKWKHDISIEVFDSIEPFIRYLQGEPPAFDAYLIPDSIEIAGQRYRIPAGIGVKSLAQKMAFEDAIVKYTNDVELIPTAIAIYFHPDIDNVPFDEDRMAIAIEKVMECRVDEAFPVAAFFFKNFKQYWIEKEKNSRTNQLPKNSPLELIDLKSSENMERFGFWRRLLILVLRKLSSWIITPALRNSFTKRQKAITNDLIKKS